MKNIFYINENSTESLIIANTINNIFLKTFRSYNLNTFLFAFSYFYNKELYTRCMITICKFLLLTINAFITVLLFIHEFSFVHNFHSYTIKYWISSLLKYNLWSKYCISNFKVNLMNTLLTIQCCPREIWFSVGK